MKKTILIISSFVIAVVLFSITTSMKENATSQSQSSNQSKVKHLGYDSFRAKIFDFENNKEWNYKGKKPSIVEFYADWCGPCKVIAPVLDEVSVKYDGKVNIYKINVDREGTLASMFGVRGIPTFLFIPVNEKPYMSSGMISKKSLISEIETKLLVE